MISGLLLRLRKHISLIMKRNLSEIALQPHQKYLIAATPTANFSNFSLRSIKLGGYVS